MKLIIHVPTRKLDLFRPSVLQQKEIKMIEREKLETERQSKGSRELYSYYKGSKSFQQALTNKNSEKRKKKKGFN